jgi:large subunit ribosomal protein L21
MSYAIISLGGKQYRVREGERLLVDRLPHAEGKTFHPDVLFVGGDGKSELAPKGIQVTARVLGQPLGPKIRIGKYRPKTGYRRHTGYRSRLSEIAVESIGKKSTAAAKKSEEKPEAAAKPAAKPKAQTKPAAKSPAQARPKAPAKKATTRKPSPAKAKGTEG